MVSAEQFINAAAPMDVTVSGNSIFLSFLQFLKAFAPIFLSAEELLTSLRLLQPSNALAPMVFTLEGMLTDVIVVLFLNSPAPSAVTFLAEEAMLGLTEYRPWNSFHNILPGLWFRYCSVHKPIPCRKRQNRSPPP